MAGASFVQTSFLGGEWSASFQGRMDLPKYRTAMNVCFNGVPIEEGMWTRRPGTKFLATTRRGNPGRVIPYTFNEQFPYTMEFTDGYLRFYAGTSLLTQSDIASVLDVTTDSPAVFSTTGTDWAIGDTVIFLFQSVGDSADAAILQNRQFLIATKPSAQQFTLTDPIDGSAINGPIGFSPERDVVQVGKVLEIQTPWTNGSWSVLRTIQVPEPGLTTAALTGPGASDIIVGGGTAPQVLSVVQYPTVNVQASFTLAGWPDSFFGGPFLDPVNSVATPSGSPLTSPTFTLDFAFPAWDAAMNYPLNTQVSASGLSYVSIAFPNVGNTPASSPTFWTQIDNGLAFSAFGGAQASDVGRAIALFNQPLPWDSGTSYSLNDFVLYQGVAYAALTANTGVPPSSSLTDWQLSAGVIQWYFGLITAVNSSTEVVVTVNFPLTFDAPVTVWQLGLYTNTNNIWPTCGAFFGGRVWLGGAVPNRVDASTSSGPFAFNPTDNFGDVTDADAIAYTFNSGNANQIRWMIPTTQGLLVGTEYDEWLIQASNLNDPITPSSIDARPVTAYGTAFIEPKRTGLSTIVVHKYGRRILEFIQDVFSGKFSAPNLSLTAKHLTVSGIAEIAHQEELWPCIWSRRNDGNLVGCTYRRISAFSTEEPTYAGWHHHTLGSGRTVTSIGVGPTPDGSLDQLTMVTQGGTSDPYHVEALTNLFDEDNTIYDAWFLDDAVTPSGSDIVTYGGKTYVRFYGLWHLNGKTVTVWAGGLDCGDYPVAGGSVDVPFGAAGGLFTQAYLTTLSNSGTDFGSLATSVDDFTSGPITPVVSNGVITAYNQYPAFATGFSELPITPDWGGNAFYLTNDGNGSQDGIWKVDLDTGAVLASNSAIGIFGAGTNFVIHPITLATDGNLYWATGALNYSQFAKIDPNTLTLIGSQFGTNTNSFSSYTTDIPKPHALVGVAVNNVPNGQLNPTITRNYLVVSGQTEGVITVWNVDGLSVDYVPNGVPYWTEFTQTVVMSGSGVKVAELVAGAPNSGTCYALGHPDFSGGPSISAAMPLYCITVDRFEAVTGVLRGTISPSQIDPTWSTQANLYMAGGFWYDPSDGNLLFTTGTLDSGVTNSYYLVKVRAADATVVWTVPLPAVTEGNSLSQVRGETFAYVIGSTAYVVNTRTGTFATTNCPGITSATGQAYSAPDGSIIGLLDYVGTTSGAPSPAPGTPITFADTWAKFTLGDAFNEQIVTNNTRLTIPCVIGFTYTSQGQLLRPQAPADTGAQNGPGFGKVRRDHQFSALMHNTQGISFGTDFNHLHAAVFQTPGGTPIVPPTLYSGLLWDTIDDDGTGFDGQLCWQITRPYPASIQAIGGFIKTSDR